MYIELKDITIAIVDRYDPERIICFGMVVNQRKTESCFLPTEVNNTSHYFLLVVTKELNRIEHEVQAFVNSISTERGITVIVHSYEVIQKTIAGGNRFFNNVCRNGELLYSADGLPSAFMEAGLPEIDPIETLRIAERHYEHHYSLTSGFMEAVGTCIDRGYYRAAIFLLNQAAEQMFITLIKVFTGYRADVHNLHRLYNFCRCFFPDLEDLIPLNSSNQQIRFDFLQSSYGEARYNSKFIAREKQVDQCMGIIDDFIVKADAACTWKIEEYKQAAAVNHAEVESVTA